MKSKIISKYIINLFFVLFVFTVHAQKKEQDTVKLKEPYGLRVGVDIFQPVYGLFDKNINAYEIVADFRLNKKFWIAAEAGYSDTFHEVDFFKFSSQGSYYKIGADYNVYKNKPGMQNMITGGLRYGIGFFSQTLEEYTVNADYFLPVQTVDTPQTFDNLSAHWIELVGGLKVEVLHNLYLGMTVSGKRMIYSKEPENFKNLFVPGFNRVYVNDFGFGFTYTISYFLPFYKK